MPSANTLLLTASLLSALVAAVPFHPQHLHHQYAREAEADTDVSWVTVTDDVVVTAYETVAVWVEIEGSSTWTVTSTGLAEATPSPTTAATTSAEETSISAASVAAPSSSSIYVAPTTSSSVAPPPAPTTTSSVYTPPPVTSSSSSSSIYTPPAPPTTSSTSIAPTPTSTYIPPPSSTAAAPSPSLGASTSTSDSTLKGLAVSGTTNVGDLTWYDPSGITACGQQRTGSDPIVAVSHITWDSYMVGITNPNDNPLCGRTVSITGAGGVVYTATVADKCPGCDVSHLDLAGPAFFNTVTDSADGVDHDVSWKWD